ncbi:MAG: hypothetical protein VR66_19275 [Peptococcaceae bacterium BRH_c23]|nr:MAG: hypothetical protein VR66_19275 [Peptococcaceae bacterium BRH_c23]
MKRKALLIFIVIALFVTGFFLSRAFAAPSPWQLAPTASPNQAQLNPDVREPANPDVSGSWYSPMNPNNQPKYYWYNSPRNNGWNNAYKDWWCW